MNDQGFMLEETVTLPVSDDISWQDFVQLAAVKNILLINPSMQLVDISFVSFVANIFCVFSHPPQPL